jgi:hypothetical protein
VEKQTVILMDRAAKDANSANRTAGGWNNAYLLLPGLWRSKRALYIDHSCNTGGSAVAVPMGR